MFTHKQDINDGCYYYFFKEKLSNNQTLEMKFWEIEDIFFIEAHVFSKRKHHYSEHETTGKTGIESLLLAKLGIKLFIEFLIEQNISKKIVIGWSDNRRRNVYYKGLKEFGFKFKYLMFNNISSKYLIREL
jgi:hypothetical protein